MERFIIPAKHIDRMSIAECWKYLEGPILVRFDDGDVLTTGREIIFSRYIWELRRNYPNVRLSKHHQLRSVTGEMGYINNGTHTQLLGNMLFDIVDVYGKNPDTKMALVDELARNVYRISNQIYNDFSTKIPEYVTSIDFTHFLEIAQYQAIRDVMLNIEPNEKSIANAHAVIKNALMTHTELSHNPLTIAARAKAVRDEQLLQCLGPVGYRTDIDSHVYPIPIITGFFHGLRLMAYDLMESKSAAKALSFTKEPLQKAEYFSRRQQLTCMNVQRLHRGDCGSKHYLMWHMCDACVVDGKKVPSDLESLDGKYFMDDDGELKIIRPGDKHLIGRTLRIRSIVAGCCHPDPAGICETCYGDTSLGIPENSNVGHQSCVAMTSRVSQIVISTKHYDGNAVVDGIKISPSDRKYLHSPHGSTYYYLNSDLRSKKIKLLVAAESAMGLPDLNMVDSVELLPMSRVSEVPVIRLVITDRHDQTESIPLTVAVNKISPNFTHAFLAHIKVTGWSADDAGYYEIDLEKWDYDKPILSMPMRQINMGDHQAEIAAMLESTVKDLEKRTTVVSPESLLAEVHRLVNRRITVNLSIMDCIVASTMVISNAQRDYRLPKPWTSKELGILRHNMEGRSASAAYAYERHGEFIPDPVRFVHTQNILDHPMDAVVCPDEVLGPQFGRFYD